MTATTMTPREVGYINDVYRGCGCIMVPIVALIWFGIWGVGLI